MRTQSLAVADEAAGILIRHLFSQPAACKRHLDAPCLRERESYLRHLTEFRRSSKQILDVASLLVHIIRLTPFTNSTVVSEAAIASAADQWTKELRRTKKAPSLRSGQVFGTLARSFFTFLALYDDELPALWFEVQLDDYLADRSLKHLHTTVEGARTTVRPFLVSLGDRHSQIDTIAISDIDRYLLERRQDGWKPRTFINACRELRTFFKFAEARGWSDAGLSRSTMAPCSRALRASPELPTWRQIRARIASLDATNASECRAKAVLLLAAVYGLRTCEIVRLTLEDFDWENEVLTVRRAKRGRLQQFPIQFEVGEAVIQYLLHFRPICRYRNVFMTLHTPYRPAKNLGSAIRKQLNASHVFRRSFGLHSLRHACATELLRTGSSLRGIADLLGHRNLKSVSIYAHCEVKMLRRVADMCLKAVE